MKHLITTDALADVLAIAAQIAEMQDVPPAEALRGAIAQYRELRSSPLIMTVYLPRRVIPVYPAIVEVDSDYYQDRRRRA